MLKKLESLILLSAFSTLFLTPGSCFAWHDYTNYGDWNYYGSGRDHPYSAYINRANYVGPADYATIKPDYIDGPLVISQMSPPVTIPVPAPAPIQPDQFTVNIPNVHGGYNAVVIRKSGEGFIGPDGEYYPEFPKIFQLQMKYGS